MNAELPPFKNGKQNSESVSTIDRDITPFSQPKPSFMHPANSAILHEAGEVIFNNREWSWVLSIDWDFHWFIAT